MCVFVHMHMYIHVFSNNNNQRKRSYQYESGEHGRGLKVGLKGNNDVILFQLKQKNFNNVYNAVVLAYS